MPYRPESRQYRNFAASNFQPLKRELDQDGNEKPTYKVKGYYTTFSTEYCLYERTKYWPAEYEQIDPHALDEADLSDVIFQENHEGSPLARIRNSSLELGTDMHGAWCIADLGGCQRGRDLYESIANGLIVEMSFGFTIDNTEDSDGYTTFKDEEGDYHTTITRIAKVYDVSAVTWGANNTTDISELRKRSYLAARIEADRKAEQESQAEEPEDVEQRSAEQPEQVMAEVGEFDVDSIVEQVIERMAKRDAQESPEVPEAPEEPEVSPEDAEQALEDVERGTQAERRRRRRMRALRMLDI